MANPYKKKVMEQILQRKSCIMSYYSIVNYFNKNSYIKWTKLSRENLSTGEIITRKKKYVLRIKPRQNNTTINLYIVNSREERG